MSIIDGSIEIDASAASAFGRWADIERFPLFAEIVEEVKLFDSGRSHWRVNMGFRKEQWDAEVTEVIPDKRIAWKSLSGSVNFGVVNFHDFPDETCLVTLHLVAEPRGVLESIGEELGVVGRLVDRLLLCFKEYVEKTNY
jgi:uncharacterized membrane protein